MTTKPTDIIKQSDRKIHFCITGGGINAIAKLTMDGGSSKVLVGVNFPYDTSELESLIGKIGDAKCVSEEISFRLAMESKIRSGDIGVGMTCKLMTDNERQGRKHLCLMTISDRYRNVHYSFEPKGLCRFEQEVLVGNYILEELAKFIEDSNNDIRD